MNWAKLKRNLERDFKRSPAKTAVLLALLPLAVYFIGPLLWKSISRQSTTGSVKQIEQPAPLVGMSVQSAAETRSSFSWRDVAAAMANDPRMKSSPTGGLQNPFRDDRMKKEIVVEDARGEIPPEEMTVQPSPEDLGLQLTATIVGSRLKLATINGKQYRENGVVTINQDETDQADDVQAKPSFVIRAVAKKHVILERDGKTYQLRLQP